MKKIIPLILSLLLPATVTAEVFERNLNYPLSAATVNGEFGVDQGIGGIAVFFDNDPITLTLGDTLVLNILFDRRLEVFEFYDPPGSTNQYFSFGLDCGYSCPQPGGGFGGTWTSSIEALGTQGDIWSGAITKSWIGGGAGFGWGGAGLDLTDSQGSFTGIRWTTTITSIYDGGPVILSAFTGVQMGADGILILPLEIPVSIDIKPGSFPNSINLESGQQIAIAILTTDTFDATQVNPDTVAFGPYGVSESHGRGHVKDVDGDGDADMILHFNTSQTGITCGDAEATLSGETFGGVPVMGSDSVNAVNCS